jgi:hypothetical protein
MPFKTIKTILLGIILILTILLIIQSCKEENTRLTGVHLLKQDEPRKVFENGQAISITAFDFADSRCPPDVACVWAGNARVKLKFIDNNSTQTIGVCLGSCNTAAIPAGQPVVLNGASYTVKLKQVMPYPGQKEQFTPRAEIVISKR